jgi:hypothetical protein
MSDRTAVVVVRHDGEEHGRRVEDLRCEAMLRRRVGGVQRVAESLVGRAERDCIGMVERDGLNDQPTTTSTR